MKLRSLHINHFGHFADFDLPLQGGGFQVLLGQNEAGKTTLLEFLRSMLFGFPVQTKYAFAGSGELGGVATMSLADGREVELRRRKGSKNTVSVQIDSQATSLDETGFTHLLGHANRNLFSLVFGFGLSELSSGENLLKHESLQSALFGGGMGGAFRTEKVLASLQTNADELFKEGARVKLPTINNLSSELKELAKQIKEKSVRSDEFAAREQALREAEQAAQLLRDEVQSLRQKHSHVEKLAIALPRWLELQGLRREREGLSVPATFPTNGRQQFAEINKELTRLTGEQEARSRQIGEDERLLEGITVEGSLLPLKAEIEECNRLIQSVADARRDQPLRQEEYERRQREIANELAELCPAWTIDDLKSFKVDAATRAEVERLIQQRREHDDSRTKLTTERDGFDARAKQNADDLAALSETRDVSALSELLDEAVDYTSDAKSFKKQQDELLKLDRTVSARALKLSPPLPVADVRSRTRESSEVGSQSLTTSTTAEPHRLPVPRLEVIAKFQSEFATLQQLLRAARQTCGEEAEHLAELEAKLAKADLARGTGPSREGLAASRQRRDDGWRLIRAALIDGKGCSAEVAQWLGDSQSLNPDRSTLPNAYETAVTTADDVADKLFDNAEAVAKREQLVAQIGQSRLNVQKKQTAVDAVIAEQQQWKLHWDNEWRLCGFEPLAPDVMERWLADHSALRDAVAQREQLAVEVDSLHARLSAFESRLRSVCGEPAGDPLFLLNRTKSVVKEAESQANERQSLEKDRRQLDKKLADATTRLTELAREVAVWQTAWQALLERLRLPTTWESDLTRSVIERLLATRTKLESLPNLKARIDAMSERLAEFARRVTNLCEQTGHDAAKHEPEVLVKILNDRLTAAGLAQVERSNLEKKLTESRAKLAALGGELKAARIIRSKLLDSAGVDSDGEFDAVANRADKIAAVDAEITRLTREIDVRRGHEPREAFETCLRECDLGLLQGDARDLGVDLETKEDASQQAEAKRGECRSKLEAIEGSPAAAELQQTLARQQARLASEVHRFVPLLFARHMLQEAIRRFERENQPELIGSISRLFCTMTAGKYIEIERPSSDRNGIIVRRNDGAERTPDQLSTGTRELLYLAIRLGYVLHYCRQAEPLPILMDDVLVNFDDVRARSTLEALRDVSQQVQVLFFTCHPHFVTLAREVFPELRLLQLSAPAS